MWWIIYFNSLRVKRQFLGEVAASAPRQFPLSISVIAWFLVVVGLCGLPGVFLFSFPLLLLGFVVHGGVARLFYVMFIVVALLSGVGMLRKRVAAHTLAVCYFVFALVNALSYLVRPGSF